MSGRRWALVFVLAAALLALLPLQASAFHEGGLVLLSTNTYTWTDPASGGEVNITENVYEGCILPSGEVHPHHMTWKYLVENVSYDPNPPYSNGLSGFQLSFPGAVPDLHNQQSPALGGPWQQNAYSGQFPPWGAEWDAPLPGAGIMPGERGVFSFCTFERVPVEVDAPDAGWAHSWGLPLPEPIVDLDGTASSLVGGASDQQVAVLDAVRGWPTGWDQEGLDWFDNDGDFVWSAGDDLHVEGAAYLGAQRDASHDDNASYFDPLVLDLDGLLADGTPVSVDLETGTDFQGGSGPDPVLKFYDADGSNNWDDGEDIVLDTNLDGVFGSVANTQVNIFNGPHTLPGVLYYELGIAADSPAHNIAKKVKYMDADGDGIIEVGEKVRFLEVIQVHNSSSTTWENVVVKDRWGAEIDVTQATPSMGTATLETKGASAKEFLTWNVGTLASGATANLVLATETDANPAGKQEYTSPGTYEYNSGAVLKVLVNGKQRSFGTGSVWLTVAP